MREALVEKDGVNYARARGWEVYKFTSPGSVGRHDRLHFKNSLSFTIEYKAAGKKASPQQRDEAKRLKSVHIPCRCCDTPQKARAFIDAMTEIADRKDPLFDVLMLCSDISSFGP